ncbi:MAG: hypothetical protein ACEQR8_01105 [Cypionkella sp.]
MKQLILASLAALVAGTAPVAAQETATPAPGGFRLPTQPTPAPTDVQGPVDPDAPILTRPRTPTPTPTAPAPRATEAAPPPSPPPTARATPRPLASPRGSTLPPRFTPPAAVAPEDSAGIADSPAAFPAAPAESAPAAFPTAPSTPPPVAASPAAEAEDGGVFGWLAARAALLAASAAGAWWFLRRRRGGSAVAEAPEIERPRVDAAPANAAAAAAPSATAPAGPALLIEAQAKQLARSMMFATLSYELKVTNRGPVPLENVSFGGDLVTAHARVPAEQQLADPSMALTPVQSLTRLDPGESASFAGEFRLPVAEIRPIPHGKAVVYVPLLRVRATAQGMEPIARTFIVGLKPPGAAGQRLQPFRLDEMPQTYRAVGQKALD